MGGGDGQQGGLFSYVSPERRIPADHPLRPIREMTDEVLRQLSRRFAGLYAKTGRPSIAPEKLLRALLLQVLYSVRSERLLMVGDRETGNPSAVYEAAIRERVVQYAKLREAAAGVIYLRGKLERELQQRSGELGRLRQQLDLAVERDDDPAARALISRREVLGADVEGLTADLTELTAEADAAKRNLVAFQDEIARLREERVRMLARL